MKDPLFYKIVRPLLKIFIKLYRPVVINKDYIPKEGRVLLVGNHTNYLDCLLVGHTTKRCVHFLAKDALYKGIKKPIFKGLGIIPVNRKIKDKNSMNLAINALNNDLVVGIFPEGTINRTSDVIMPFKYGAVKMASVTNSTIIPFSITGKFKLFKKSVKIVFDKPYKLKSEDLDKENKILMNKIKKLIIENKEVAK